MNNSQISLIIYFLAMILLIILFSFADAHPATFHTVVKGDTLSGIAKQHLGSWQKWKDLAKLNNLTTEWRKGIPYVLIRPGQFIRLQSVWTGERISDYRMNTIRLLEREIFRMAGIYKIPKIISNTKIKIDLLIDPANQYDLRIAQIQIKNILKDLANKERLNMAYEVFSYSALMPLYFFDDRDCVAERKTAVLLMAMMSIESYGRFVEGQHGELGIYQQKPETFMRAMGYKEEDLPEIKEMMMTSHYATMKCAIKLLERGRNPSDALMRYNGGQDKKAYARKVMKAFYEIMDRGK